MNKNLYEKPNTDVLVIRFEGNILSNPGGYQGGGGGNYGNDDTYDNGDY